MKLRRRFLSLLVCVCLLLTAVFTGAPGVNAASNPTLTVDSVTAVNGDKVILNIAISGNTALMAVTLSIHYDNTALEYSKYYRGILKDYLVVDHGTYLSFVNCEYYDCKIDGNLISIEFTVKDTAQTGFYPVTLKNIWPDKNGDSLDGCLARWNSTKISPTAISGGVTVGYNGNNCTHDYSDWSVTVPAKCTAVGVKSRNCKICGHNETAEIPATGHSYSSDWTIDKAATENAAGSMSRHCADCDAVTDKVAFTVNDATGNGFANTVGTVIKPGSWKTLAEITEKNEQKQQQNADGQQQDDNAGDTETQPEIGQSETDGVASENAQELIVNAKKNSRGLFGKAYRYLFGEDGKGGLIHTIRISLPDTIRSVLKHWKLAAAGIIILQIL